MALPTIRHHRAATGTDSALLSVWMTKLQELLFLAGWTVEFANADAIGTGSAAIPAWSMAPVPNTDAGIAVYRMPANGHSVPWFVRLTPGWALSTDRGHMRSAQVGRTHTTGTIGEGNANHAAHIITTQTKDSGFMVSVSEDGMALYLNSSAAAGAHAFLVERVRNNAGTVMPGVVMMTSSGGTSGNKVSSVTPDGVAILDGVLNRTLALAVSSGSGVLSTSSVSTKDAAGESAAISGPFFESYVGLTSPPRLMMLVGSLDGAQDAIVPVEIDGAIRDYRCANASSSSLTAFSGMALWPMLAMT